MHVTSIRTPRVEAGDSLFALLDSCVPPLAERDVVVITSKIVSLAENRIVPKDSITKYDLIRREADLFLEVEKNPHDFYLTVKDGILVLCAGIDESNVKDVYVLYPEDVQKTAASIWTFLREKHGIQELGILITDTRVTMLRRGVTGFALGWCGFEPLYSYIGQADLYGRPLCVTQINIPDALATAAVFTMGEGNEQTPLALIREAPKMSFVDHPPTPEEVKSVHISMQEDVYGPLLRTAAWTC